MPDLLAPAIQDFIVNSAPYIAGIDEMIRANVRLAESIKVTQDQIRAMEAQAAGGAGAAAGAAGAGAAAGEQEALTAAERQAAEAAKLEAEMAADLEAHLKLMRDSSLASADAQKALSTAYRTTSKSIIGMSDAQKAEIASSAKAAEGSKLLGIQAALSGKKVSELKTENGNLMQSLNKVGGATILAGAAFAGYGMKAAADFQQQILRLKTSAGNTGDFIAGKFTGDLKVASDGILKMSVDTGTSAKELAQGMYVVQSANIRVNGSAIGAADALKILRAASEGAKIENADVGTVTNALTTVMNDYHLSVDKAVPAMNALIAGVSAGKTNLQDLAGAMHSVMPIASSVHLSIGEVVGALATMTAHGVSADLAGQHLANMMRNLVAPMPKARAEMTALGLNATDVAQHFGERGLTGTLDLLFNTISHNVDKKTGLVLTQMLDKSKEAAAQAKNEFAQMPPSVQKLAKAFMDGSGNVKGFGSEVSKLPLAQQELLKAFEANSKKSMGFSTALKGNKIATQTFDEALKKVSGGAVGLEAALQLTGENMDGFKSAVTGVNAAMQHGGAHVENWQKVQKTFNQELDQAKQAANRVAITIGTELLPKVQAVMTWLSKHPTLVKDLAIAVGIFLTAAAAIKVMSIAMGILNLVMTANPIMLIIIAIAALVVGFLYLWTHVKGFRDFWISAWHDLQAAAKNTWAFLTTVWNGIAAGAVWLWHAIEAVGHGIAVAFNAVVSFIAGIPGAVVRILSGLYNDMVQMGKNVVVGLWNGLVGMGQWLWDKVTGWIKSVIPAPIAHILGINSPSTLMHEYGQHVGEGLALGIVSKHGRVMDAAAGLAKAAAVGVGANLPTPAFTAVSKLVTDAVPSLAYASSGGGSATASNTHLVSSLVPTSPASAGSAAAGGAQIVNVHLEVHGSVVSQRDLENSVQQAVLRVNIRNPNNRLSLPAGR